MIKIIHYLQEFYQEHPKKEFYLTFIIFNALCIFINYYFQFEISYINNPYVYQGWHFFNYFIFYSFAWFGTFIIYHLFYPEKKILYQKNFWKISLLLLSIFTIYVNFDFFYRFWVYENIHHEVQYFVMKCLNNTMKPILILPIIYLYWKIFDYQYNKNFYGLIPQQKQDLKLYLWMFLFMIPLVVGASFTSDFLHQYPRYLPENSEAEEYLGWKDWQTTLIFEFCYGVDFIFIELFFRGFILFALMRYVGSSVIFGMATVYVFIHFEKPVGETIGSLFGGLILGVLSYKTESIWGGIAIHLGIAWLMEAAAWAHRL